MKRVLLAACLVGASLLLSGCTLPGEEYTPLTGVIIT